MVLLDFQNPHLEYVEVFWVEVGNDVSPPQSFSTNLLLTQLLPEDAEKTTDGSATAVDLWFWFFNV